MSDLMATPQWQVAAATLIAILGACVYLVLRSRALQGVLRADEFQQFPLVKKTIVSHNVAIYQFSLPSPKSILGLPTGQHISVGAILLQPDGSSKDVIRAYTPISDDSQPGSFDLLIKTYPMGNISRHMATLEVGQKIRVRGPKGSFLYTPNMVRAFGMVAGGTGITPMFQVLQRITQGRAAGDKTEIDLIYANVSVEDILLRERLQSLTQHDPRIRIHYVLDKPPTIWNGGVGYVTADMATKWLPKPASDVKILLCGPPPMVNALKKLTKSLGYEGARPVSKLEDQVFAF